MSRETRTVYWTIDKAPVSAPVLSRNSMTITGFYGASGTFNVTRTGNGPIYVSSSNTSIAEATVSGTSVTVTSRAAGNAVITVTVGEGDNYQAYTGSDVVCAVNSEVRSPYINLPAQSGTLTYDGTSQTPAWDSNYDSQKMALTVTGQTNAGDYSATFTPNTGYLWADTATYEARTASWTIGKATPGKPVLSRSSLVLNGAPTSSDTFTVTRDGNGTIYAVSSNTNVATVSVSGTTVTVTSVADGTANITVTVGAGTNYFAYTATDVICAVSADISSYILTIPTQRGTLTYDGTEQTPSWDSNYKWTKMTEYVTAQTNAGNNYTATFTPVSGLYVWSDDYTRGARYARWAIGKATPSAPILDYYGVSTYGSYGSTVTVHVTSMDGDGAISAVSSDTSVGTVSVNGNAITITYYKSGEITVTVTVGEGTNYFAYTGNECVINCLANISSITLPAQVSGERLEYIDNTPQQPTWDSNYESFKMTLSITPQINAGDYSATFTPNGSYKWADTGTNEARSVEWTIHRAAPTFTAPTARSGLVYNGSPQTLINAGSSNDGTLYYKLEGGNYSTSVPTYTSANANIKVYYYVEGDSNHTGTTSYSVYGSIGKKPVTITAKAQTITYGNSIATGTGQVTTGTLVVGHTLDSITLTQSTTNATTNGAITPSAAVIKNGNTDVSLNYEVTYNTGKLVINKATPSVTAPTAKSLTYSGTDQYLVNAGSTSGGTMMYSIDNVNWGTSIPKRREATSYTVYYKVVGGDNYEDVAASYVSATINSKSLTITAKDQEIYFGDFIATGVEQITVSGLASGHSVADITLTQSTYNVTTSGNITPSMAFIKNGSEIIASNNYAINYVPGNLTINKTVATVVTAPTAKSDLVYTGHSQELINAGTANGGTMEYSLDGTNYSESIPTRTSATTGITVYYKVVGDSNHSDSSVSTLTAVIDKASFTSTVSISGYTYAGTKSTPTVSDNPGNGTVTYYGRSTASGSATNWNNVTNTTYNAGTRYCYAVISATDNYYGYTTGNTSFTIAKATPVVTAPTAKTLTYNGSSQSLVNAGSTTGGTLYYSLNNSSWSTSIPTGTNQGSYTVYYKVTGGTNYVDVSADSVSVTIGKKALTITAKAQTITYGNSIATGTGQVTTSGLASGDSLNSISLTQSTTNVTTTGTITPSAAVVNNSSSTTVTSNYTITYNTGSLTINKAAPTYTAPTAKSGLVYNGSAQTLINAGAASGGTMYYKLYASGSYSTALPTSTNASTSITVYYYVKGDSNHSDTTEQSITASIARATPSKPALSKTSMTISGVAGSTDTFTATRDGNGTIYATSSNTNVATVNVSGTTVTVTSVSDGTANITVTVGQGTNYNAYTATDAICSVTSVVISLSPNLYGSTTMTTARYNLGATTVGNYALFAGGTTGSTKSGEVFALNTSATASYPTALSTPRSLLRGASIGNYALFAGGANSSDTAVNTVETYTNSLTRSIATGLGYAASTMAAASGDYYAFFAGGLNNSNSVDNVVNAYSSSLSLYNPMYLSESRTGLAAAMAGEYYVVAGGYNSSSSPSAVVDTYSKTLVKSTATSLSAARTGLASASNSQYAMFGGGASGYSRRNTVDCYNSSLTMTTKSLSAARSSLTATTLGEFVLFGGGGSSSVVDAFDASLTRTVITNLSAARQLLAASAVGNYAAFAGGYSSSAASSNVVDIYTLS